MTGEQGPSGDYWGWRVGCMPCTRALSVEATNGGLDALRAELGDDFPITPQGVGGRERSRCGLNAFEGKCPDAELLSLVGQLIRDGEVPGVRVA